MIDSAPQPNSTVLVIDDSRDVLTLCTAILKHAGYSARTASSGLEGVEKFSADPADLVLLDVNLPDMSGVEVLAALQERYPGVRVLLSSGYDRSALDGLDGLPQGSFLKKPWGVKELLSRIETALSQERTSSTGA